MPLNNILNSNVKQSNDYHCVITEKLGDKESRKFSMEIPTLIVCPCFTNRSCAYITNRSPLTFVIHFLYHLVKNVRVNFKCKQYFACIANSSLHICDAFSLTFGRKVSVLISNINNTLLVSQEIISPI